MARATGGRILVAMSGGVDSSLAAALLHQAGHPVVGVTLHLWDAGPDAQVGRCCAPEDRDDARRTCDFLGVPHYVIDERAAFRRHVVDPFVRDNLAGRTPSPCVHCNQQVKLGRLWELARELGCEAVATGHYARLRRGPGGRFELLRGTDRAKDQSYFLYGLEPALLQRLRFPLGELDKGQARAQARRLGLPNWDKPDSQELCFVPDGDVAGFVGARSGAAGGQAGDVVDSGGRRLGRHRGVEGFTVGQRRGLGISGPAPRYVLRIVAEQQRIVVGAAPELLRSRLGVEQARWLGPPPVQGAPVQLRIRYRHDPAPARLTIDTEGSFSAVFDEPQPAIAPGQAAVAYDGERVLGGGIIVD